MPKQKPKVDNVVVITDHPRLRDIIGVIMDVEASKPWPYRISYGLYPQDNTIFSRKEFEIIGEL